MTPVASIRLWRAAVTDRTPHGSGRCSETTSTTLLVHTGCNRWRPEVQGRSCFIAACLLIPFAPGPSAFGQKVNIKYDHEADFSRIRQYQWRTHAVFEKNPQMQHTYATGIQLVMQSGN